jgi:subfamily B ATP-binding cassette protein MsbA
MAAIRSPMMPAFQLAGTSSRLSLLLFHSRKFRMSPNQLLLSYALRYPGWIVLSVLLDFSSALFSGVGTALIVPLVLGLLGQANIKLSGSPPIIQKTLSFFEVSEGGSRLWVMLVVVVLAISLKNISIYVNSIVSNALARKLANDIRKEGIKLLLEVDL